ncbi:MAG: GGDEF domain-containing protein [Clostridia bacterium]|nr:GGDEF domain-containing protein [Clostridia bacterium]
MKNDFYVKVLNGVKDGIYFVDTKRKITFWNKSAEDITGYKSEEILGNFCYDNILDHVDQGGCHLCHNGCPLQKTLNDGIERTAIVYLRHKAGHRVETKISVVPIVENDQIIGAVETFTDDISVVTANKNIESLKTLAYYDVLTGLPNRRFIEEQVKLKIVEFEKLNINFGFALIDIDWFKHVNDDYGHDTGDEVLKLLAKAFKKTVRGTDFIGRWGGEEFVAVFSDVNRESLITAMERVRVMIEASVLNTEEFSIQVTVSIGGALVNNEDTVEDLLHRSDQNLYYCKSNGRNQVKI